ncbi:CIC11C00000003827 [Sungouiella intermedia]|uniref:CIC11C00000003827 n=1 Tax=Sungouiella intermedia TaxID=45354 RepID=A0A1L0DTE3_9ASCO|nr:CIC11C00000003827 [[Candida] intermedia]
MITNVVNEIKTLNTMSDNDLYNYNPSEVGAAVFAALFGMATLVTMFQLLRIKRKRTDSRVWTNLPFILGGVLEFVGYIARIFSGKSPTLLGPFIALAVCLLVSPALFAGSVYMVLGRVIVAVGAEGYSLIRLKWLTKIFVFGDILSFLLQGSGGSLMSQRQKGAQRVGKAIVIIGLVCQIVFFSSFMIVTVVFQYRVKNIPTSKSLYYRYLPSKGRNWQMVIVTLLACSLLILVRCIVRTIEFVQGWNGYIMSHEVYLFVFDSALMFLTMVVYACQDVGTFFHYFYEELISGREVDKEELEL